MKQAAFTILELAIVLVVLGLLTGGILAGQSLIRAAELRGIATEMDQIKTSIMTFREKYSAFPGDMTNATEFWGRADTGAFLGQCADPVTNQGTGTQTCNGDGDGRISAWTSGTAHYEVFRAWQHLSNADMMWGKYTGVHGTGGGTHHQVGINSPVSKIVQTVGYSLMFSLNGPGGWFPFTDKTILQIGAEDTITNMYEPYLPVFTPQEAFVIDGKIDDGRPGLGNVRSQRPPDSSCPTSADPNVAEYNADLETVDCQLMFFID